LIVGDLTPEVNRFDVIVETNSHELRCVSPLNPSLMALQYPLLFRMLTRASIWVLNMLTVLLRLVIRHPGRSLHPRLLHLAQ
jgi:hypothetical protein